MEVNRLYMERALQLAALGRGHTRSNPMVGAVVVAPDGEIIGEGYHHRYGGAHAEVNAIASVRRRELLPQSTIYVTLEPCSHYGKTPPCAKLLIDNKIPRIVVGSSDPNARVSGRGIAMLRQGGAEVITGVLEEQCRELNRPFMIAHTLRRPYIMLKWAMSADGFMDRRRTPELPGPAQFSSAESQMLVHRMRSQFDAIMVGSSTVTADNPRLDTRLWPGSSPRRIVLDRRNRLSGGNYRIFSPADEPTIHITDYTDLTTLMAELLGRGITSVLVEGGTTLLTSLLANGLWDDARIETAPFALGSKGSVKAPPIPSGNIATHTLGNSTILEIRH